MEPGLRDDLATKADLRAEISDLKAAVESKLRPDVDDGHRHDRRRGRDPLPLIVRSSRVGNG
jgi:hypothetical protein